MERKIIMAALACALLALPATAQEGLSTRAGGGEAGSLPAGEWCLTPVVNAALADVLAGQRARLDREVSGAYLGVTIGDLTEERAKELGLGSAKGAVVTGVIPGSPAASAGLRTGDVVVSVDGKEVASAKDLTDLIGGHAEGQQVTLELLRDGKSERVTATLARRAAWPRGGVWQFDPEQFRVDPDGSFEFPEGFPGGLFGNTSRMRLGVTLLPLTDQLREHFGVEAGKGALVSSVTRNSPAERAGLRAGDVILAVDGQEVRRTGDVASALAKGGETTRTVQIEAVRDRSRQTFAATVEATRPPKEE